MNLWRVGLTAATNASDTLDYYGSTWRTTMLEPAGSGTYSQWTTGQPDWRARSVVVTPSAFTSPVTANTSGQKISY